MKPFLELPSTDFVRVRDGRNAMPAWIDIDLSTARSITGTGANAAMALNIAGNSFYSDQNALQGIATVHFQDTNLGNSSAPITVNPGFIANVPYTQLLIENVAQAGYRLRIFYGVDVDFQPGTGGQVTVGGTVSVINGELSRVKAGNCLIGMGNQAAVAGQYSHVQLFNPGASGKNLILNKASITPLTSGLVALTKYAFALGVAGSVMNKNMALGAGVGQLNIGSNAAVLGTYVGMFGVGVNNDSKDFPFSEPILIPPGNGVCLVHQSQNVQLFGTFQWNEENI